jgi:predicted O-methyltransferase YrrM
MDANGRGRLFSEVGLARNEMQSPSILQIGPHKQDRSFGKDNLMPGQSQDLSSSLITRLNDYIEALYAPEDDVLDAILREAHREGLPHIHVRPEVGKLLALLVGISGATRVLEIGTLAGYSAVWLGRALPENGRLYTLEVSERHATVARHAIAMAGLEDRVEVLLGPALDTLARLPAGQPFDMVFIDADKESYPAYLNQALRLTRQGGLIVADNVLRDGAILDPALPGSAIRAIQDYNERVARDERLEGTILLTRSGSFGLDGLSVARVRA